ncbi:pickpocket protein 19-like [Pseudomyrmex gracilis]|uniref:pickpocket protein 19-like n=1 Tax=Pseudomyrmex gracilis TaxID=219809 RepID=UPI0009956D42|nr:pickpocket protein 19-like [Pseudomyrmex gracilis]
MTIILMHRDPELFRQRFKLPIMSETDHAAPTSITIETMDYENSNLPFPSVTLCPNDRVDWNRALELESRIFPNDTDGASRETFRRILGKLSIISFGDFDELKFLKHQDVRIVQDLSGINITQVLREVIPHCNELLSNCWWHNATRNCCEIFELQKTEYGFCYSFNSELAEKLSAAKPGESRPRKTFGYGKKSGVKVTIHLGNIRKPPNSEEIDGVVVIINTPLVWPNSGTMIPSGSLVNVALDSYSGYATQRVLNLDKQPCRYEATGTYSQETCLSLCKRSYVIKYCGCNPSFLFPANTRYRDCTIGDFACLINHNVSFGGIISLFLGGSVLSAIELVYYLIVALYSSIYRRWKVQKTSRKQQKNPAIIHTTMLPILDYSPVKPRAEGKIPIFAKYPAKSNSNRY